MQLVSQDEIQVDERTGEVVVTVPVYAQGLVTKSFAERLSDQLSQIVDKPVVVRVVSFPLVESSP